MNKYSPLSILRTLLLLSFACVHLVAGNSSYPPFSWEKVPVYVHYGSRTQLTDEQVELTARLSDFICLEKGHGKSSDPEHPERIAGEDMRRIKAINPDAKVLMYWNTLIAWPFTSYNRDFAETHPKDWTLRDMKTGEPLLKSKLGSTPVYQYNLLNPAVQQWWADTISGAVNEFGFDGFFMDAVSQSKRQIWLNKGWGKGKEEELDEAAINMMKMAKAAMEDKGLIIFNGFRTKDGGSDQGTKGGTEFLPYTDGAKIEHFDQFASASKEDILLYWKMAKEASDAGKIVVYKAWPDHDINWLNKEFMSKSPEEKEAIARDEITYPLACFLIGAYENCWFCYGWGYQVDHGQLIEYPEYSRKLGAPKGDAVRRGWKFSREFKHAKVEVDLNNRKGTIQWLEN